VGPASQPRKLAVFLGENQRMNDGIEAREACPAGGVTGKDDCREACAVDAGPVVRCRGARQYLAAECAQHFVVGRLAGFDQSMRNLIGFDDVAAQLAHHLRDGAFAASDPAGESYTQHVFRRNSGRRCAGVAGLAL
jgi:hypothetical protein